MKTTADPAAPDTTNAANPAEPTRVAYRVLVRGPLQVRDFLFYRDALVNLTKEEADAINTNQPGTVEFAGIQ